MRILQRYIAFINASRRIAQTALLCKIGKVQIFFVHRPVINARLYFVIQKALAPVRQRPLGRPCRRACRRARTSRCGRCGSARPGTTLSKQAAHTVLGLSVWMSFQRSQAPQEDAQEAQDGLVQRRQIVLSSRLPGGAHRYVRIWAVLGMQNKKLWELFRIIIQDLSLLVVN